MMGRLPRAIAALLLCAIGLLLPPRSFAAVAEQAALQVTSDAWDARFAAPAMFPMINHLVAGDGSLFYLQPTRSGVVDWWDGSAIHTIGQADRGFMALAYGPGSLYVSGSFTAINGVQVAGIARWDVATKTWHGMNRHGAPIYAILPVDTYVYTVGDAPDYTSLVIERWDSRTQTWQTLAALPKEGGVTDVIMFNNSLYIAFDASSLGVVRFDLTSNTWRSIVQHLPSARYYYPTGSKQF
jgi:hypothetical protein